MKKHTILIIVVFVIIMGYYIAVRPDACKEYICEGDTVYRASDNGSFFNQSGVGIAVDIIYEHQIFNIYYGDNAPLHTTEFNQVIKLKNSPSKCVGLINKRPGC